MLDDGDKALTPITWRGHSRIEYSHAELLDLVDVLSRNTAGDGHNIVSAFNGNTIKRLIAQADIAALAARAESPPIDMVLYCPECGTQHVDRPTSDWPNPPHRSHLCLGCGHIWRPADVATNGVEAIQTAGKDDSARAIRAARDESQSELLEALKEVRAAIMEHAPDTLWVSLIETAVDRIDSAISRAEGLALSGGEGADPRRTQA